MIFQQLLETKDQADALWIEAERLSDKDTDLEDIENKFEEAFTLYQTVYQQLKEVEDKIAKDSLPLSHDETVQQFFISKTLADAHFDRGEMEEAIALYTKAENIRKQNPIYLKDELNDKQIDAISFNLALAELRLHQAEGNKPDISKIVAQFTQELKKFREQKKKSSYAIDKMLELLFESGKLLRGISLKKDIEKKVKWLFSYVLSSDQILNAFSTVQPDIFKSEKIEDFLNAVQPPLQDWQRKRFSEFSPPKSDIDKVLKTALTNIAQFKTTEEYAKLNLYPHQKEAVDKFEAHLANENNVGYYTAATGSGKTRTFLAQIIALQARAIVLAPSLSLVEQTKERLEEILKDLKIDKKIGVFAGSEKTVGDIVIMTNASLKTQMRKPPKKREIKLDKYEIVVLDEAHLSLSEKAQEIVHELREDKIIVACTATEAFNVKRPKGALYSLGEMFGEENGFFHYPIDKAIDEKILSPIHICMVTTDVSLRWRREKKRKDGKVKDLTEKEINEQINKEKLNTVVAEIYANGIHPNTKERIFGKPAVAFCTGILHAEAVAAKFNALFKGHSYFKEQGITPAVVLSGEQTREEQKEILERYRQGKIAMLCGADLLTTGIDLPDMAVAFMLRPTKSKVMALQRGGRVVRKSKQKSVALVFEFNWLIEDQVFLHDFLQGRHQLGEIPETPSDSQNLEVLRREECGNLFPDGAKWELNWKGDVRACSVGVMRRKAEIKVPEVDHRTLIPPPPLPLALSSVDAFPAVNPSAPVLEEESLSLPEDDSGLFADMSTLRQEEIDAMLQSWESVLDEIPSFTPQFERKEARPYWEEEKAALEFSPRV